eukprot:CAMPEP_0178458180 /NCGR_PEP_ID=MMETSP0689_2-20121128/47414_1 /TAXON_ID=160604 /ORGANISM="Amphidinium massartii, Strain CS-259" /LENGTH=57 /DNA_ID=CAMNT_0020084483 /DNA_START=14 /DNA_END=187 /DNA_ORIENTATION=-
MSVEILDPIAFKDHGHASPVECMALTGQLLGLMFRQRVVHPRWLDSHTEVSGEGTNN